MEQHVKKLRFQAPSACSIVPLDKIINNFKCIKALAWGPLLSMGPCIIAMKLPLPLDDPNAQLGLRITTTELDTVRVGGQGSLAQTSSTATGAPTENLG